MKPTPLAFTLWLQRGFSLIEVTLAMGVVSFGLVALVGVMPVGLTTLRRAFDLTAEGMIVQKISGEARLTAFTQLSTTFANKTFYYDMDGLFLTNSPATAPTTTRYWVTTTVADPAFPGSANVSTANPFKSNLQTVSVQVVTASSAAAKNKSTNFYQILVPSSGN